MSQVSMITPQDELRRSPATATHFVLWDDFIQLGLPFWSAAEAIEFARKIAAKNKVRNIRAYEQLKPSDPLTPIEWKEKSNGAG